MTKLKLALLLGTVLMAKPFLAHAGDDGVPIDCDPATCDAVPVTPPGGDDMPSAGDAEPIGTAPGQPIEAPETPNTDPIAPNEPPTPDTMEEE